MTLDEYPRYLVRASQADHKLIERLLSPGLWTPGLPLEGIVLDAAQADRLGEQLQANPLKAALADRPIQILLDHQVYRLTDGQHRLPALARLPYSRNTLMSHGEAGGYSPSDFSDHRFVTRFVQAVFDYQSRLGVTDYTAPAFFVSANDSAWFTVNESLRRESVQQAGTFLYGTICVNLRSVIQELFESLGRGRVSGVYVLVSPFNATRASVGKLLRFTELLKELRLRGLNVVAARQPAFGLVQLALDIAGFDSGIAQSEGFDFPSLVRRVTQPKKRGRGSGRARRVYFGDLLTSLSPSLANRIFAQPGLRSSFACNGPCCRERLSDAVLSARDHFLWGRMNEIQELRAIAPSLRPRFLANKLSRAAQLSKKILRAFPDESLDFSHLVNWSSALEATASVVSGEERRP